MTEGEFEKLNIPDAEQESLKKESSLTTPEALEGEEERIFNKEEGEEWDIICKNFEELRKEVYRIMKAWKNFQN